MNLRRIIDGIVLSIIFLLIFVCSISGVKWVFDNSLQGQGKSDFLGSVSAPLQNITPKNTDEEVDKSILVNNSKPEISAESAISIESDLSGVNKVIFAKEIDKKLPIASLTKLMTAVIVLDNYNLTDTAVVDKDADSQAPMKQDIKLGSVMSVENFLDIMLVGSSNKSAYALAKLIGVQKFVELMNQKAEDLGLKSTFFADPTGLNPNNISTASDLAKLASYILKNYPKIAEISRIKELYIPKFGNVVNTDELLGEVSDIVCSKTGFTAEAGGCLLLVVDNPKNNDYLINIVLGTENRFLEMQKLINWSSVICQ